MKNQSDRAKGYWATIHAIQAEHGCDVATAKRLNQNGTPAPGQAATAKAAPPTPISDLSPKAIVELALSKAEEVESQIAEHEAALESLKEQLSQWRQFSRALDETEQYAAAAH